MPSTGSVSELSHGSFGGLAQHVESVIGDNWQPAIPPSITGCSLALQIVHYCAFRAVQTIVQLTEFSELYKIYLIHATLGEMP